MATSLMKRVLLIVDMQRDFMPAGEVPVPGADALVPVINQLMRDATRRQHFDVCLATRDWHPPDHVSFAPRHPDAQPGTLAPTPSGAHSLTLFRPHCVAGTPGAEFAEGLETQHLLRTFHKGQDPSRESHSGLYDLGGTRSTGLPEFLREMGAESVCVVGVALEVCVRATVLDCLEEGLETVLLLDAVRPAEEEAGRRTVEEVFKAGCKLMRMGDALWEELGRRGGHEAGWKVHTAKASGSPPRSRAAEL